MSKFEKELERGFVKPSTLASFLGVPPQMIHNYASKGVFVRVECGECGGKFLDGESVKVYLEKRKEREEKKVSK